MQLVSRGTSAHCGFRAGTFHVEQVFALSSHFFVFHVEHRPLHRTPRALFHVEPLGGSELAFQRRPKRLGAQIFHVERSRFRPLLQLPQRKCETYGRFFEQVCSTWNARLALSLRTPFLGSFETLQTFSGSEIPPHRKRITLVDLIQNKKTNAERVCEKSESAGSLYLSSRCADTLNSFSSPRADTAVKTGAPGSVPAIPSPSPASLAPGPGRRSTG
jgi:hypothetical protein